MTNYAIRKQKFCLKRDKSLRMGFCREDPPIDDVFVSYKLEKKNKKKKKTKTNQTLPPKLRRKPRQPRSQGSLLPALRSARERIAERTWERGWSRGRCTFFPFTTLDARVIKTNFKAMKKKSLAIFLPLHSLVRTKIKTEYKSVGFFFWFIVNVTTGRL